MEIKAKTCKFLQFLLPYIRKVSIMTTILKKSEKWYFLNNCSATRMKREILNIVSEVMSLDASYTLELEFYM